MRPLEIDRDTICAIATAPGKGALSVIRVSGPEAADTVRKLAGFLPEKLESHRIYYGFLRSLESDSSHGHSASGKLLDEVLVSFFQEGRSFTGQQMLEISCHGGEILPDAILRNLILAGARPARRGEFTYRGFLSGRIDLVQAESVQALIGSRSTRAADLALRQLRGEFSQHLRELMEDLTWLMAQLEANIDFASEDIVIAPVVSLVDRTSMTLTKVRKLLAGYQTGRLIREGLNVVLVGRPNAGKSSLLNRFVGESRAIVTPFAGTTRDFIEAELMLDGLRTTLVDTAGLRISEDPVEKLGVERTLQKMKAADFILYVVDANEGSLGSDRKYLDLCPVEHTAVLLNKMDMVAASHARNLRGELAKSFSVFEVSAANGSGISGFKDWLRSRVGTELSEDTALISHARHFDGLQRLANSLERALPLMIDDESPDLIAVELDVGLKAVFEVLGLTYVDQVMDRVFSEFCLGK